MVINSDDISIGASGNIRYTKKGGEKQYTTYDFGLYLMGYWAPEIEALTDMERSTLYDVLMMGECPMKPTEKVLGILGKIKSGEMKKEFPDA